MSSPLPPPAHSLLHDDENAMALIADLKKQLGRVSEQLSRAEDECDLLAEDNHRLRELCQRSGIDPNSLPHSLTPAATPLPTHTVPHSGGAHMEDDECFLVDAGGDEGYASTLGRVLSDACGTGNALCVAYLLLPDDSEESEEVAVEVAVGQREEFVLCGGVDKTLRLYALHTGEVLYELELAAPILAIDCLGALVACSMMDGSHAVVDLKVQKYSDLVTGNISPRVVQNQRDHTKYAVSIKWSPCGTFLVTASHDKTVVLYKRETTPDATWSMKKNHTLNLKDIPEDVVFCVLPNGFTSGSDEGSGSIEIISTEDQSLSDASLSIEGGNQLHLIVPTRGSPHLLYINCITLQYKNVSLNEQAWDSHVSFNVLHLSLSPNAKHLLVATDKDFHIILKTGTNKRLSLLAGHMCNDYGKPKTCWDVTGKYVYSNNQADHNLLVYAVNTGKIVTTLTGHRGQIRDIKSHPKSRAVITASYDHTLKEWLNEDARKLE